MVFCRRIFFVICHFGVHCLTTNGVLHVDSKIVCKSIFTCPSIHFLVVLECILSVSYQGLTEVQAQKLLAEQGKNFHSRKKRSTFLQKFLMQFADLMIVILLISAAISFAMALFSHQKGELTEPIIIVVIVIANALLGAIQ